MALPHKKPSIRSGSSKPAASQSSGRREAPKPSQRSAPERPSQRSAPERPSQRNAAARPSKPSVAPARPSQRDAAPAKPSQRGVSPARSSQRAAVPPKASDESTRRRAQRTREEEEALLSEPPEDPRDSVPARVPVAGRPQSSSRLRAASGASGSSARRSAQRVEPAEPRSAQSSARMRSAGASQRGREGGPSVAGASARRSQRVSIRDKAPAKPMLTMKHKILGIVVLALLVVVVIGYRPVRYSMLVSSVTKGDKASADVLFSDRGWRGDSVSVFAQLLKPATTAEEQAKRTEGTPAVGAYGLGLAVRSSDCRSLALGKAKELMDGGPDEARRPLAGELKNCAAHAREKHDNQLMAAIVPMLIQCVDAQDQDVRLAGIQGLGCYEAPNGGSLRLLKVAREEKDPFRSAALSGIEMSATPDAVSELLNAMSQQDDKPLAEVALKGFAKVREQAETAALMKQLTNPSANVRLEIVRALALRKADADAGQGIVRALADVSAPVRCEAVTAFPLMRIDSAEAAKLEPLITDADETVRVAAASTLGKLSDETSWKLLEGAFKKDVNGKTLDALLKSVALRGYTKSKDGRRDLKVTRMVVDMFDKHPDNAEGISKTLSELTALSRYPNRLPQRAAWSAESWKSWQENAEQREVLIADGVQKLKDAQQKQGMEFKAQFGQLLKQVDAALELLEKAKASCKEDPEDEAYCDDLQSFYSKMRYHFQKDQALDFGPRN